MSRFTQEEIEALPNILDVLDHLAKMENEDRPKLNEYYIFGPEFWEDGYFYCSRRDIGYVLAPTSQSTFTYLRGQNKEYSPSYPSLFRQEYSNIYNQAIARAKSMEFILIIMSHPVVQMMLKQGIYINFDALCQHYGFATQIMDLTNNKWVAAFMASTKWDKESGKYLPIGEDFGDGFGVLYISNANIYRYIKNDKITPIGYQFFKRPSMQSCFGMHMEKNDDFTKFNEFDTIYFRHDIKAASYVYAMSYRQNKFSPHDYIAELANEVIYSKKLSSKALSYTYNQFYKDKPENFMKKACECNNIEIIDKQVAYYDSLIMDEECKEWIREGQFRVNDKITKNYPGL